MEVLVPLLVFLNVMGIVSIGWFCRDRSNRNRNRNRENPQQYDEERILEDIAEHRRGRAERMEIRISSPIQSSETQ